MEKKLLYFMAIVEESSFEKAAEKCNISQTAISRQLIALENELGVKLFDRKNYRARLTEPGRHFYEKVKLLYFEYEKAVEELQRESGRRITIGISGPMDMKLLPRFLKEFHKKNPDIQVEIKKKTFSQLVKDLEELKLDVIFGLENEMLTVPDVQCVKIMKSALCVAFSDGHPFQRKEAVSMQMLKEEEFIIFSPAFSKLHYSRFVDACQRDGFTPKVSLEVDTLDEMILQVSLGRGVAILSKEVLSGNEPIMTRPLRDSSFTSEYCVAYQSKENLVVDQFLSHILELCE